MITVINTASSTAFIKLGYNEKGNVFARFSDRPEQKFIYTNVPAEVLEGLKNAESKGRFFAQNIRHNKVIVCTAQ